MRITYTYDGAGNRTQKETPVASTYYTWTARNWLASAETVAGVVSFTYDGVGKRVAKDAFGVVKRYIWDDAKLLQETDDDGLTERQYLTTDQQYGDLVSAYDGDGSEYYTFDGLGSTQALLDDTGSMLERYAYQAFGLMSATVTGGSPGLPLPAPLPSPLGSGSSSSREPATWVGKLGYIRDPELDLYLMGAGVNGGGRMYDPTTVRFLTTDPSEYFGNDANLYRYAGNDPVNKSDATGREPLGDDRQKKLTDEVLRNAPEQWDERRKRLEKSGPNSDLDRFHRDLAKAFDPKAGDDENRSNLMLVLEQYFEDPAPEIPDPPALAPPPRAKETAADRLRKWEENALKEQAERDSRADRLIQAMQADKDARGKVAHQFDKEVGKLAMERERTSVLNPWRYFGTGDFEPLDPGSREAELRKWSEWARNQKDFAIVDGKPVPITEAGKAQVDEWLEAQKWARMTPTERLYKAYKLAREKGWIEAEIGKQLDELLTQENIAIMVGFGGAGLAASAAGGLPALVAAGIGYLMFGQAVIEVGEDLYMGISGLMGARSEKDIEESGKRTSKGLVLLLAAVGGAAAMKMAGGGARRRFEGKKVQQKTTGEFEVVPASKNELKAVQGEIASQVEEVARRRALGTSSAGYNAAEEAAALELERQLGKKLTRDPSNAADWMVGKTTYDHWTTNPAFFEQQLNNGNLLKSLKKHVNGIKSDYAVVDSLGLNEAQLAKLKELINGLSPAERTRIIDLRGNLGLK